jgi:polysaccharide pyruvyl transferase WcaK-like protein
MCDGGSMRIGLLDAMGYGNLGDAAIQDSVIVNIQRRLPRARVVGFSFVPEDTVKRHGIHCYPLTRHSQQDAATTQPTDPRRKVTSALTSVLSKVPVLRAVARAVKNAVRESLFLARSYEVLKSLDLLIISGGGQLCDLWGGAWAHPYNVFKFSVLARLAGSRLYFLNVGAEPLEHRLSRFFAKSAVRLAHYVSFRDAYSQTLVRRLGVKAETSVHADCAYGLEGTQYVQDTPSASARQIVGVNPMGFCDPRVWPRQEQSVYESYLEKLTSFSLWLLQEGYHLTLFTTSRGVDQYAVADLKRRVVERRASSDSSTRSSTWPGETVNEVLCESVNELLGVMSGCDFVVTSKYHGVIFCQLLMKPVIALSYQKKIEVAMQPLGEGRFCASIEHFEADWLIDAFRSLVRDSETIKAQEAASVAACADTLRRQFDELFSPRE